MATNTNVEKQGPYSAESGIIAPHPEDPNKSQLYMLMTINIGQKYLPKVAIEKLIKSEIVLKY